MHVTVWQLWRSAASAASSESSVRQCIDAMSKGAAHPRTSTWMRSGGHVYAHACACRCACMRTHLHLHAQAHTCTPARLCAHVHVYTRTHVCARAYACIGRATQVQSELHVACLLCMTPATRCPIERNDTARFSTDGMHAALYASHLAPHAAWCVLPAARESRSSAGTGRGTSRRHGAARLPCEHATSHCSPRRHDRPLDSCACDGRAMAHSPQAMSNRQ